MYGLPRGTLCLHDIKLSKDNFTSRSGWSFNSRAGLLVRGADAELREQGGWGEAELMRTCAHTKLYNT